MSKHIVSNLVHKHMECYFFGETKKHVFWWVGCNKILSKKIQNVLPFLKF